MTRADRLNNTPTGAEKAAMKGTHGRPSASDPFVNDSDPRLAQGSQALDQFPAYSRTLLRSQTLPDHYYATLVGPITIPAGVSLVILGDAELHITD